MIYINETKLKEILMSYFCIGDSDTYQLTRVKESFLIGTMKFDNFVEWDEKQVDDLIKYIKNKIEIMSDYRLIDANKFDVFSYDNNIVEQYGDTFDGGVEYVLDVIEQSDTIIPADKED